MNSWRPAVVLLAALSIITGVVYPLVVTGVAQFVFPRQAGGSLVFRGDRLLGSQLIGQPFDAPQFFWGRPSATTPAYNGGSSSGSNLGPTSAELRKAVEARIAALRRGQGSAAAPIPVDLVTASASGLDPHISPAAADWQVPRVARARGMTENAVRQIVARHTLGRTLGFLGESRVNVVELNLELETPAR
ncbi:MAG TPA: potassium-transporting ATPase subunit KdpC [Pirellulales bacterium]